MRAPRPSRAAAALFGLALAVTACGETTTVEPDASDAPSASDVASDPMSEAPSDDPPPSESEGLSACQVTDTGGVDDKSFNETAFAGLEQARDDLGVEISVLESQDTTDFEPNINAFLDQGCDLIVTVGFLLGDATAAAAEANPDTNFAIVDVDFFNPDDFSDVAYPNTAELNFSTDEAAFLAGYLAAGSTQTGKIGTFGGLNIPPVTIFMDGFEAGMDHYNEVNGTAVELIGWDRDAQDGLFTGDFEDQDKGRATTESLLDEGADIVMPVAGPVGLGGAAAIAESDGAQLIWVDSDGCESTDFCDIMLTSVKKNMDVAVYGAVESLVNGAFADGLYLGTLENGGVGLGQISPDADAELVAEVEALQAAIIAGEIDVKG